MSKSILGELTAIRKAIDSIARTYCNPILKKHHIDSLWGLCNQCHERHYPLANEDSTGLCAVCNHNNWVKGKNKEAEGLKEGIAS